MRRSSSSLLWCALFAGLLGCGDGVEVSLQLRPGLGADGEPFDTAALRSLRIAVDDGEDEPDIRQVPLDRTAQVGLERLDVDKQLPFTIDVWGCPQAETCFAEDVLFRGCTDGALDFSDREGTVAVAVDMLPIDDDRLGGCAPLED